MNSLESNIPKLRLLLMAQWALPHVALLFLFVQENGVDLQRFMMLPAAFCLFGVVLEIPSGYLSDRWSRKHTLIIASCCLVAGTITYAVATRFEHFLLAELFLALWISFNSGTIEALTYDSLLASGKEEMSRAVATQQFAAFMTAHAVAVSLAGFFAEFFGLRALMYAGVVFSVVGLLLTLSLKEPPRKKLYSTHPLRCILKTLRSTLAAIPLRRIVMTYAVLSSLTYCLAWMSQPVQEDLGLPMRWFGIIAAFAAASAAIAARIFGRLHGTIRDRSLVLLIGSVVCMALLFSGLSQTYACVVFLVVGRSMWGPLRVITTDMINKEIPSDVRATVLSVNGFVKGIMFAVIGPFAGFVAAHWSTATAFFTLGMAGVAFLLWTYVEIQTEQVNCDPVPD